MKVVVVSLVGVGGMAHYNHQLCEAMAGAGAEVTMITTEDYELRRLPRRFELLAELELWPRFEHDRASDADAGPFIRLLRRVRRAIRRGWRAIRQYRAWLRIERLVERLEPDVVQLGNELAIPGAGMLLRRLRRHGCVLGWVCHEIEYRERRWGGVVGRAAHRHLDIAFVHGDSYRAQLTGAGGLPADRVVSVPHGNELLFESVASPEPFTLPGVAASDRVVLFFGGLRPSKGVADLVDAFASLPRQGDTKLVIAGYPERPFDLAGLRAHVERLGLADDVVLDLRYVPMDEVAWLIRRAEFVVLPYRSASQSGALQVAYAFARPVIATAVGGLPEVVEDGRSGLLVPPASPAALSRAMSRLLADPETTRQMGAYARRLAETRFAWDPIGAAVVDAYRSILAGSREGGAVPWRH